MDDRSLQIYERALQEGKVPVRNIRVMVVGHFGVGKSTLTKRLLGMPVDIKIRKSTEGIDIHTDRCKLSKDGTWILPESGYMFKNVD
jgi:GTPase SAR1 family protein